MASNNPIIAAIAEAEQPYKELAKESNAALAFRREAMFARTIIQNSWQLRQAEPKSVYDCILDAATVGFTLNPQFQHATIIPRNVNIGTDKDKKWVTRAFLMPMYRGLVHLAIEGGKVLAVEADAVYTKDQFKLVRGARPILEHTPYFGHDRDAAGDEEFVGVWVKAILKDLGPDYPQIGFMPAIDIFKARDGSDAYRDKKTGELFPEAPWRKWFNEQSKKAGLKREQKLWPHNIEGSKRFAAAIAMDEKANRSGDPVRPEAESDEVVYITHDQQETLGQMLARAKLRPETFMGAYGIDKLSDLPIATYAEAEERLSKRISSIETPPDREPGSDDNLGEDPPATTTDSHTQFVADMDEHSAP